MYGYREIRKSARNLTLRLILHTQQDSNLPTKKVDKKVKLILKQFFTIRLIIALLLVGIPSPAHAGVISFVSGLFSNNDNKTVIVSNSQNMTLLEATTNPDSNYAKGGGDITIVEDVALVPEIGPSGTISEIEGHTSDKISIYVVRKGDSLSGIAKMFGVSTNTIAWANDLGKKSIQEGQTLVILPVTGVKYEVKKGDTLAGIAKKFKGDLDEIQNFNNLSDDSHLAVGDIVIIPDGEVAAPAVSSTKKTVKGSTAPSYSGYYMIPVNSRKSQGLHGYNAIDIAAHIGTPIVASASGEVIISRDYGWNGGYGEYIVIQHGNGTQTLYGHCSEIIVGAGQSVVKGQVIGYVGNTGKSTGPHVHFEIRGAKNPF